jgi:small subunit ribosomal protein S24e
LNLRIENKKQNLLQHRWELNFTVEHNGQATPKRDEMRQKVAEVMGAKKEQVVIDRTVTETGTGVSHGYAKVYDSVDSAKKTERNYMQVRHGLAEKKKKVAVAATARAAPKIK